MGDQESRPANAFGSQMRDLERRAKLVQASVKREVTRDTLNNLMGFDYVIKVNPDGTVEDGIDNVYAPESLIETDDDGQISAQDEANWEQAIASEGWSLFSTGYTGQYGYHGAIMHASEYIGGRLADDILSQPGLYVAVVVTCLPNGNDDDSDSEDAGWAVCYREN